MKLAEALLERSECQERLHVLESRLQANLKIQEGDEPQLWSSLAGQWSEYRQWAVGELERSFRREFKGLAAQKGWRVSVIGQEPLELQLGTFTLRPQWREGLADLYYARLPLRSQLPLVSERILEVAASESQLLNGGELPEEKRPKAASLESIRASNWPGI